MAGKKPAPKPPAWLTATIFGVISLCCVGAVIAGSGDDDEPALVAPVPSTPAPTTVRVWPAEQRSYLTALRRVNAALVADEEEAITAAGSTCDDLAAGEPTGDALATQVAQRLSGAAPVSVAQARQVIALAKTHLCPWAEPPPVEDDTEEPVAEEPEGDPGSAYYANCAAAKRAGAAPLRRGDPGYRRGLDRDGDGVACDT